MIMIMKNLALDVGVTQELGIIFLFSWYFLHFLLGFIYFDEKIQANISEFQQMSVSHFGPASLSELLHVDSGVHDPLMIWLSVVEIANKQLRQIVDTH